MNDTLTYDQAVELLTDYAKAVDSRDELIRQAHRAHMNKSEIARRMNIDRGVVIRVLGSDDEEG